MNGRLLRSIKNAGGQVLILMALLMTTLIIFFGMVVNIGHLVQAKINLQNAVDLAAMAGSSWQARYLNHLALINYRMRQNYKFVLFDIYVTQSRHNRGFQQQVSLAALPSDPFAKLLDPKRNPGSLTLGICQTIPGYEPSVPEELSLGLRFPSISTDFCRLIEPGRGFFSSLPDAPLIPIIPVGGAIVAAQQNANRALRENCEASNGQNGAYFNYIIRHLRDRNLFQMEEISRILLRFSRAFTVNGDLDPVAGQGEGDSSIIASFKENLITANRDNLESDSLVYLNPPETRAFKDDGFASDPAVLIRDAEPGGNFSKYFERQLVGFELAVIESQWTGAGCRFFPRFIQAGEPGNPTRPGFVFLGLSRSRENKALGDPEYRPVKIPFQITLRAKVKPNLLFWPRGLTPTLVAIGSAKPFGSRIAPPIENVNFEVSGSLQRRAQGQPANLSFYPGDIRSSGANEFPGVGHVRVLKYLDRALRTPGGQFRVVPNSRGQSTPERPSVIDSSFSVAGSERCQSNPMPFICSALAPTLYEGLLWTVFPDPAQALGLNPSQAAEYPSEFSLPIGTRGSTPDIAGRLSRMGQLYRMPDRMRGVGDIGTRSALWHVSTLLPPSEAGVFSNNGKPLFYANESSAASAFNPDWDPASLEGFLAGAPDGRRGYQIRLISMDQACEEIEQSNAAQIGATMKTYCRGEAAVFQ